MNLEDYERHGRGAYAAFASTVAAILTAAINAEGNSFRLQQVKSRAKEPASLRVKLEKRGLAGTEALEGQIKDLAGCRVIFYMDSDVNRFIHSGLVGENFEILEVKVHHPRRDADDAAELYTSNHYVVALKRERLTLPEYAGFAGMRCEIQIQTILHHAWAEMAHDTIYKAPELASFGGRAFDDIRSRLRKVARRYLVPAGYEFQKIASDFQRLVEGKALFDGNALEAIVEAADNNARADAIETFAERVLPLYDDPESYYPEVVARLLVAVDRARETGPVSIETPFGILEGKTSGDILRAVVEILARHRYLAVDATFDALCRLYGQAASSDEEKRLIALGKKLAGHDLAVWRQHGPVVQTMLLERMVMLGEEQQVTLAPLLITMLQEILGTQVEGTIASSSTVTLQHGAVVASELLRTVRTKALDQLKRQFELARTDAERGAVLHAMQAGTQLPWRGMYSNELQCMVMDDIRAVVSFLAGLAATLGLELTRVSEVWVHHCYRTYSHLPDGMRDDAALAAVRARVVDATLAFRDVVNRSEDFVFYKTLVGYDSVLACAWQGEAFRDEGASAFREQQIDGFIASIDDQTAEIWFERINRYAQTESNDAATFIEFCRFLEQLARDKPSIILGYANRVEGLLERFLPSMLAGLMQSAERTEAVARIDAWLCAGRKLKQITWYLRLAAPFDADLLRRALASAIQHEDLVSVRNALLAADMQYKAHPETLVEDVFLPALRYLEACSDFSWLHQPWVTWFERPIVRALDDGQAGTVLASLVGHPRLDSAAENLVATLAERWPERVMAFLGARQEYARSDVSPPDYDAIPFAAHALRLPLAAHPAIVLDSVRTWFDAVPELFPYDGGRLLAAVFPDLAGGLAEQLTKLVESGDEDDLAFVLAVLLAYPEAPGIYDIVRKIVAVLVPGDTLLLRARAVLENTGVVRGAFGFVDVYETRRTLLQTWLADPHALVQQFAADQIHRLEQRIAAETRIAEANLAHRRLQYGEELDQNSDA
ncbi:RelA/SpoT domain-containing protein [Paraburkholderia sp. J11-2]|uniref:RelA/SpoT domain-containing protein n=1 Tax=Paraburkholderia sp. J11-2 TaxID=2805431 RepID=UPI002AB6A536|nr:RelA/SpoT domain-containing protein [Paraburkholderia sp. J11-2]